MGSAWGWEATTEVLAVLGFLGFAAVGVLLVRVEPESRRRWALGSLSAAAGILALSRVLGLGGLPSALLEGLGWMAGLAGCGLCLATLLRGGMAPAFREARALRLEKEAIQGRMAESEEQLGRLVDEIQDYAIFHLDSVGGVTRWNRGAERLHGWAADEILGRSHACFYPEEAVRAGMPTRDLDQARATGSHRWEAWQVRQDGGRFLASVGLFALHGPEGGVGGFLQVTRDITDRMETEVRLQRLKQESMGRLAGGIAHDFNNLLGAMLGNLEAAEASLGPGGPTAGPHQAMGRLIHRATNLVAQILAYTGNGKFLVRTLDLNREVGDEIRVLRASLEPVTTIRWAPGPGAPHLLGDLG